MKKIEKFFLNEFNILFLIILNAILIFVQEFELKIILLDFIEPIFTLVFVIEMLLKIRVNGLKNYFSDAWNRFDFIIILISSPSLASIFINENILQVNIFLTFRVFRIFKFFRLIRFFPNIGSLIKSINQAVRSSYIVILGFFLSVFIVSLVSCSLFKNIVPEYFSDPINSFYSIFRLFSIEGWYEIPDLIASRTSTWISFFAKLYFVVLLLFGGILGLSLVNSIFVDAMLSDNNDDLKEELINLSTKIESLTEQVEKLNKIQNN